VDHFKKKTARIIVQKTAELCKALMGQFLADLGDNLDIIKVGDELGAQESLLLSPDMYREILKSNQSDLIQLIIERTKKRFFPY